MDNIVRHLDGQDWLALAFFFLCWAGYARYADHKAHSTDTLLAATNRYRLKWMREMTGRDNRSVDAIMIGNLQRSITFFANTTIFILIGLMGMLSYHDRASAIIGNIPYAKPMNGFEWEMRIFLLIFIFIFAYFKYTWSLRQYNYAGIFVCAAPPHKERIEELENIAARGAHLISNAAKHFNNALRAYYFGLAALGWFIHPYLFILATAWVVLVIFRREYRSATLKYLAQ